jgi:uncharacterized protein YdaU (DUF1376 family)
MAKSKPPYFRFYPRDFIGDPTVGAMSPEATGGYIRLLCFAWMEDQPGTLPDDDEILARLSGLGERWAACRDSIRRAFRVSGKRLLQKRMAMEADALERYLARQSANGKLGAEAKWGQ